jgi:cell division protein FtsZ
VMSEMGKAMMGTGESTGDQRALQAAEAAISNPLLDDVSLKGARAVLVNITGGQDMSLFEVDEAVNRIRDEVDPDANIIFGSTFSDTMEGKMRVSVVATGIDAGEMLARPPVEIPTANPQARKPFGGTTHAPRKEPTGAAPRERSPAEIVRQAGTGTVAEVARHATPRAAAPLQTPQAQPVIRIIDESVRVEEEQQKAWAAQQQAATAQASQLEQAMRLAANGARASAPAPASAIEAAGPLFVSPRAEQPQQRTLFAAQSPEIEDEDEEEAATGKNIFGRLANVGKAFAGAGRAPSPVRAPIAAPAERKAEVRETVPHAGDEEEFYDIPAFLRRQAN